MRYLAVGHDLVTSRLNTRWLNPWLSVLALIAIVAASCGGPSSPTGRQSPDVTIDGLRVTMPSELRFRADGYVSTGEEIVGYYSNIRPRSACSSRCTMETFMPLEAGAIVVEWGELSGFGIGGHLPGGPAPNTSVGGQDTVFTDEKPGSCGGDETISARIRQPGGGEIPGDYLMRACLKGPDLVRGKQVVEAMLASVAVI